jgi:hypothetical protein
MIGVEDVVEAKNSKATKDSKDYYPWLLCCMSIGST